ncbi:sodium:calcium antiporter [Zhengella mangrovi]|uniref:Sodium:calcium antiporter n=1 Tax=Zhengella mangrovi TaxID=1982044 RepID=A0A2G1QJE7_9HYPH|nr:calcium/sodium antiporter [Zhengella mangrovi]PHP65570.1 sodium:calcium antiporter [Zhengella mangrovi]
MTEWLFVCAGLVLLFAGGEALVRGAVGLSRRFGVSELVIGLTIVGFGTSTPELLVSLDAALSGESDIALGNVIGSNTANVLLIIGISTLIAPIMAWDRGVRREAMVMAGAALVVAGIALTGTISMAAGIVMLGMLGAFLVAAFRSSRRDHPDTETVRETTSVPALLLITALGLAALFGGARLLVDGATTIATSLGVSQAVIGLTIVAVGTSLPELATSLVAAIRGNSAVSLGNIVGSNIFNVFGILGITAIVTPVPVSTAMQQFDIPVMVISALLLLAILRFASRIPRLAGAAMLAGYAVYVGVLYAA